MTLDGSDGRVESLEATVEMPVDRLGIVEAVEEREAQKSDERLSVMRRQAPS